MNGLTIVDLLVYLAIFILAALVLFLFPANK